MSDPDMFPTENCVLPSGMERTDSERGHFAIRVRYRGTYVRRVQARDLLPDDKTDRGVIDKVETDNDTTTITFRWTKDTLGLWSGDHVWIDRAAVAS